MANPKARTRKRKRVHAVRRAPDGSAFQKCDNCGVSVAIALADMHECEIKKEVQRFRGVCGRQSVVTQSQSDTFVDQPRESFVKTCKTRNLISIDQTGFGIWKNMTNEERKPYIIEAKRVDSSYLKALLGEVNNMQEVDDEADSAMVGKFDQFYEAYGDSENSYISYSYQSGETEIIDTYAGASLSLSFVPTDFLNFMKQPNGGIMGH
uniref:HMG box domain-containing protein n=1 Tax=Fagus sylvatica TaxID=28930 RepID=A0A2N9J7N6_FAGSY